MHRSADEEFSIPAVISSSQLSLPVTTPDPSHTDACC